MSRSEAEGKQFLQCRPWPLVTTKRRRLTSDNQQLGKPVLDLNDDDPQAVDMALRYLYRLDYPSLTVAEVSPVPATSESPGGDKQTEAEAPENAPPPSPPCEPSALAERVSNYFQSYDKVVEDLPRVATKANASQFWPDEEVAPAEPEIDAVPATKHAPEPEPPLMIIGTGPDRKRSRKERRRRHRSGTTSQCQRPRRKGRQWKSRQPKLLSPSKSMFPSREACYCTRASTSSQPSTA